MTSNDPEKNSSAVGKPFLNFRYFTFELAPDMLGVTVSNTLTGALPVTGTLRERITTFEYLERVI